MQHLVKNAVVVTPGQVFEGGWLLIEGDRIAGVGDTLSCPTGVSDVLDARGLLLLPGLIDLHCDMIEKLVEPRPEVHFALPLAFAEADWRLAGCGITTEFHAVSLDDEEFGVRSATFVQELIEHIRANRLVLVRHRVHARLEVSSEQGFALLLEWAELPEVGMISLMDHTPGQGQYQTAEAYRDYVAKTTGRSPGEIDELLERKRVQMRTAPERVTRVADLARRTGRALASHDDDTVERVASLPELGVTISEFPTTLSAALHAHDLGLAVCMGAPNALRAGITLFTGSGMPALAHQALGGHTPTTAPPCLPRCSSKGSLDGEPPAGMSASHALYVMLTRCVRIEVCRPRRAALLSAREPYRHQLARRPRFGQLQARRIRLARRPALG